MYKYLAEAQALMERREQIGWRKHEKELKNAHITKKAKNEDARKMGAK